MGSDTKEIPVGYQLHIHSWENDADSPATEILSGLTKEDVNFYLEILSHFKSKSQGGFANTCNVDCNKVAKVIMKTLAKHPNVSPEIKKQWNLEDSLGLDDEDGVSDACRELMGDLLSYPNEDYAFRVFDGFEVFHIEAPVQNVTSQFKAKR